MGSAEANGRHRGTRDGNKVIISTHSPVLLDLVWALRTLKQEVEDGAMERDRACDALKRVFRLKKLSAPMKDEPEPCGAVSSRRRVASVGKSKQFSACSSSRVDRIEPTESHHLTWSSLPILTGPDGFSLGPYDSQTTAESCGTRISPLCSRARSPLPFRVGLPLHVNRLISHRSLVFCGLELIEIA